MPDITIDISSDEDDDVIFESDVVPEFRMSSNGVTVEMRFTQAHSLFCAMKAYFDDDDTE